MCTDRESVDTCVGMTLAVCGHLCSQECRRDGTIKQRPCHKTEMQHRQSLILNLQQMPCCARDVCCEHLAWQQRHSLPAVAVYEYLTLHAVGCMHIGTAPQGHEVEPCAITLHKLQPRKVAVQVAAAAQDVEARVSVSQWVVCSCTQEAAVAPSLLGTSTAHVQQLS
jgi:hypothetical protein